ncbi:hypothetical protein D9M71_832410 [compost metagenome]
MLSALPWKMELLSGFSAFQMAPTLRLPLARPLTSPHWNSAAATGRLSTGKDSSDNARMTWR